MLGQLVELIVRAADVEQRDSDGEDDHEQGNRNAQSGDARANGLRQKFLVKRDQRDLAVVHHQHQNCQCQSQVVAFAAQLLIRRVALNFLNGWISHLVSP